MKDGHIAVETLLEEISYRPEPKYLQQGMRLAFLKKQAWKLVIVAAVGLCIVYFLVHRSIYLLLILLAFYVLCGAVSWFVTIPWKARRLLKEHPNDGSQTCLRFGHGVLEFKSSFADGKRSWFSDISFNKNVVVLFCGGGSFMVVPRSAFSGDDQFERFVGSISALCTKPVTNQT